jgi:hypothetical protein
MNIEQNTGGNGVCWMLSNEWGLAVGLITQQQEHG